MASAQIVDAIILSTLRYGETSKVVRMATRALGVQSALAKGASRPRSRFGASLQLLSEGQAGLILSRASDLHTLTGFDVARMHSSLAERLDRYATATALAEVMLRFAPPAPVPGAFDLLRDALDLLAVTPGPAVDTVGLRMLWRLISLLGYSPILTHCAKDGVLVPDRQVAVFSFPEGGVLCPSCAAGVGGQGSRLAPDHREALTAFLEPSAALPALDGRHEAAHRRLLTRWVRWQLGSEHATPALDLFEQRPWETPQ